MPIIKSADRKTIEEKRKKIFMYLKNFKVILLNSN